MAGLRLGLGASAYQRIISNNSYAPDEKGVNPRQVKGFDVKLNQSMPVVYMACPVHFCMWQENASLREQLDDVQGQLLSRHVEEGQQLLMRNSFHDMSLLNLTHDQVFTYTPYSLDYCFCWLRGTAVERWSLSGELFLTRARPVADGWPHMWVSHLL